MHLKVNFKNRLNFPWAHLGKILKFWPLPTSTVGISQNELQQVLQQGHWTGAKDTKQRLLTGVPIIV